MDFYQDDGASGVNACDDIGDRSKNHEYVILYEDKNSDENNYQNVTLSTTETSEEISKITTGSLSSKIKGLFKKVKNFIWTKPKRIFLRGHQFFGCSHLMAMRFYIHSINNCEFKAAFCRSLSDYKRNTCFRSDKLNAPRMGYYADRASSFYKKSNGNFFLETRNKAPYCYDLKTN